jgi:capsular exopolysaccharide synthesis family protein
VTMAQGGKRTILVDCDLRKPSQHDIWGISREPGLTNMMLENQLDPPLCDVGVENLWVLPAGPMPPNPADLLGSPKMGQVIERLKELADVVLFDAPPVIAVTDAALLATQLDGALLVLKMGGTRRDYAERAKALLEQVNVRIVGVVLTNAQVDSKMTSYGA